MLKKFISGITIVSSFNMAMGNIIFVKNLSWTIARDILQRK